MWSAQQSQPVCPTLRRQRLRAMRPLFCQSQRPRIQDDPSAFLRPDRQAYREWHVPDLRFQQTGSLHRIRHNFPRGRSRPPLCADGVRRQPLSACLPYRECARAIWPCGPARQRRQVYQGSTAPRPSHSAIELRYSQPEQKACRRHHIPVPDNREAHHPP